MRIALFHDSGGYREEETPSPISNLEAKLFIADNTFSYWDGNVGRCRERDTSLIYLSFIFFLIFFHFETLSLYIVYFVAY